MSGEQKPHRSLAAAEKCVYALAVRRRDELEVDGQAGRGASAPADGRTLVLTRIQTEISQT